jgi:hypothetical protein
MAKPDMSLEPKITCYKIFIFPADFRISKTFSPFKNKFSSGFLRGCRKKLNNLVFLWVQRL